MGHLIFVPTTLNTDVSGTQAGLFSVVSAVFVTTLQQKLEPNPNEINAAYMQILIHAVNNSLFPDVDPGAVTWTGPPSGIVTAQSLLYASLATSLLAAFLAMLGKQWINRYARTGGGSAAERGRGRQRKLDGLQEWRFHLFAETLQIMPQLALLLLAFGVSEYLWTTSITVASVVIGFAGLSLVLFAAFGFAAAFDHNCPYQTPFSFLIRHFARSSPTFTRLLRYQTTLYARLYSQLKMSLVRLRHVIWRTLYHFGRVSVAPEAIELAHQEPHTSWNFGEISTEFEVNKGDARCISWTLGSTTNDDVIFCTAQFAVDTVLYPEIADIISPFLLRDHFLACLSDGRVVPDKLEHVSVIGLALASVLSIQLCIDPEREDLRDLSRTINDHTDWISKSEPIFLPGVAILGVVSQTPGQAQSGSFQNWKILSHMPGNLSTNHKLCLSRTMLQTIWRWRRIPNQNTTFNLKAIGSFCRELMANDCHVIPALKTNCFLIMAICLGDRVGDIRTLFTPNDEWVVFAFFPHTLLIELQ